MTKRNQYLALSGLFALTIVVRLVAPEPVLAAESCIHREPSAVTVMPSVMCNTSSGRSKSRDHTESAPGEDTIRVVYPAHAEAHPATETGGTSKASS